MSTTAHVKSKPSSSGEHRFDQPLRENNQEDGETPTSDDEGDAPAINDVKSLKKGIIRTSKNKDKAPYTVLLVGETGTGKSSLLEFIANVLIGNTTDRYDFQVLDHSNEQGGSSGQSQTNSARIYEFTSKNGILVRILDAPGLADTRGIEQDERHKKSISTVIQKHIASVSAVLILANGSVPRITAGMDYALSALSALSALFPKTLAKNIAFMFTNSPTRLSLNFSQDAIPMILKRAPQFLLDNPIALRKKYLEFKDGPNKKQAKEMQKAVKSAEQKSLEVLVDLFDWLDSLEPQPTTEIMTLYEKSQAIEREITNALAQMEQAANKMADINELMREFQQKSADVEAFSNFEKIINTQVWRQRPTPTLNYVCTTADCYSTCIVEHSVGGALLLFPRQLSSCAECDHYHWFHFHLRSEWVQVQEDQKWVDDNMKKKWETAKDEKEKSNALVAASTTALDDLGRIIDEGMDALAELAAEYAGLSLSGSFSAPLEKAIWLLEQRCRGMEEKGVSLEQLEKVRRSLDQMKGRLELLRKARAKEVVTKIRKVREQARIVEEKAREGVRKVEELPEGVPRVEETQEGFSKVEREAHGGGWKAWETVRERFWASLWR